MRLMAPYLTSTIVMALLALVSPGSSANATSATAEQPVAYSTVVQAAIYGLPVEGMMLRLSKEVLDPKTRKAPFNAYYHYTELATPEVSPFRAPNNDTLYSTAWLDLRSEPVILEMPDTGGRYLLGDNQDEKAASIKVRTGWCWRVAGRA